MLGDDLPLLTTAPTRPISDAAIGRHDFTIGKKDVLKAFA